MLSTVQEIISILPISYYPVTRPWRRKKLTISILATLSIVVYAALTTWNVLTQGREPSYTTVLRTTMPSQHDTKTKCQVRTLQVGDMIYASPSGAFAWSITGVDSGAMQGSDFDVGVNYAGAAMQANVTSLGMFYYWSIQSFKYGVCANATVPQLSGKGNNGHSVAKATDGTVLTTVITMCAHFDLDSSDVPAWATAAQTPIQNAFYDLAIYFQTLDFPNGTFPTCNFPPYCDPNTHLPPPLDTTISPSNAYDLTAWMSGIRYLPETTGINFTTTGGIPLGEEHAVIVTADGSKTTLVDAFEKTYVNGGGASGSNIGLTGIGAMHLLTQAQNSAQGFTEPDAITTIRSGALGVLNILGDTAVKDLHDRVIGSSYLCTVTGSTWRSPLSLIAMILGNNASLFGLWIVLSVAIARRWEHRIYRREIMEEEMNYPEPMTPVAPRGYQSDDEKDEVGLSVPYSPPTPSHHQPGYPEGLSRLLRERSM